jgi:hypothetical protein
MTLASFSELKVMLQGFTAKMGFIESLNYSEDAVAPLLAKS